VRVGTCEGEYNGFVCRTPVTAVEKTAATADVVVFFETATCDAEEAEEARASTVESYEAVDDAITVIGSFVVCSKLVETQVEWYFAEAVFDASVHGTAEFLELCKATAIEVLNVSPDQISNVATRTGSVIVSFTLTDTAGWTLDQLNALFDNSADALSALNLGGGTVNYPIFGGLNSQNVGYSVGITVEASDFTLTSEIAGSGDIQATIGGNKSVAVVSGETVHFAASVAEEFSGVDDDSGFGNANDDGEEYASSDESTASASQAPMQIAIPVSILLVCLIVAVVYRKRNPADPFGKLSFTESHTDSGALTVNPRFGFSEAVAGFHSGARGSIAGLDYLDVQSQAQRRGSTSSAVATAGYMTVESSNPLGKFASAFASSARDSQMVDAQESGNPFSKAPGPLSNWGKVREKVMSSRDIAIDFLLNTDVLDDEFRDFLPDDAASSSDDGEEGGGGAFARPSGSHFYPGFPGGAPEDALETQFPLDQMLSKQKTTSKRKFSFGKAAKSAN
jgi:hypothetical protein